ncbi:low molecular weight phosphotyrosine protein phosphatase [Lutimonas saemankumensis]|uniref:low molecular weight protein-tyrosine-phosphatase n=1 Tax=Lutimonas saemankumensis TaxID=483016 RepID=UPI001CD46D29|nr:low molecular weight protein-tyrosine-phosphatase [Lutimonas saemankumensis]MCA0932324.1 low molecular weight phosphotyrosine protein phosphatase [Lutimonas saemankumensis]
MVRVLMVCLGNICRSPLAEGILKSKVNAEAIFVDSAGTGGWHVGELPDVRSMEVARKNQIDISDQRCRKFSVQDFIDFDLIYVMDSSNLRDVLNLAGSQNEIDKVKLILNEMEPGMDREVPDPYYGGNNGFDLVFKMLDAACEVIAKKIEK